MIALICQKQILSQYFNCGKKVKLSFLKIKLFKLKNNHGNAVNYFNEQFVLQSATYFNKLFK